ncbi:ParB/RepB/Spo0J family partition protein [Paenibacillus periandrae]|uniref:ParB/RepB/Spo0J family partition protein n=1 Tax=Paenibacillus periandrae TaxID=1761741 RepID=UPI001F09F4B2|nr:ParB/RepB/Spo0J family partition protein [Paenibacillus periandrae]
MSFLIKQNDKELEFSMQKIYDQIQSVPINQLTEHPLNQELFSALTPSEYGLLRQGIQDHGLQHPLLINKEMVILSGNCRWRICKELGYEYIDAKLVDYSYEEEAIELLITENKARRGAEDDYIKLAKQMDSLHEAWNISAGRKSAHDARDNGQKKRKDVAAVFGMSEAQVGRHLQLLKLNPNIQSLVSEGNISLMGGVALSGLSMDMQNLFYDYMQQTNYPKLTVNEIKTIIESLCNTVGNSEKNIDSVPKTETPIDDIEEKEIAKIQMAISKVLLLNLSNGSKNKLKATIISTLKKLEENA